MKIEDAVYWAVKRSTGPLGSVDQVAFDAWLAGDRLRMGALARAEAGLALVDRAYAYGLIQSDDTTPRTDAAISHINRRRAIGWSAVALTAGLTTIYVAMPDAGLTTRVGEIRKVRLADSSVVTLNTQSRVSVDLRPKERQLSLDRGEAWFQVAHERARPFIVAASDLRVRAVGTAFAMRRATNGVDVLVTQGTVLAWRTGDRAEKVAISAGHRAFVPDNGAAIVPVSARETIDRALAWRRGGLSLAGETLDYAISELNRYNDVQLHVDDPVLGRAPIVGYFRVDDPLSFARSVAMVEDAEVELEAGQLRLVPRRS